VTLVVPAEIYYINQLSTKSNDNQKTDYYNIWPYLISWLQPSFWHHIYATCGMANS